MARGYLRSKERQRQIVDVARDLISQHGVQATTLQRIAAGVGITTPGLYGHFSSRREILLAVIDNLYDDLHEIFCSTRSPNALNRLREIGMSHIRLAADREGFGVALFELIAASPGEELREALGEKNLEVVEKLAAIVKEGQSAGTIRHDIDPYQVGWTMISRAWAEDIVYLMGLEEHWGLPRSRWMLENLLKQIAAPEMPVSPRLENKGRRAPRRVTRPFPVARERRRTR